MNKKICFEDIEHIIRETLDLGKAFKISPNGSSMMPLIRQGKDSVFIKKPGGSLKKYDIAFYKRNNGQFVLHRIIKVKKSGYVMCGDNQWLPEHGIKDSNILGVVTGIEREGKYISCQDPEYKKYVLKRVNTRVIRNLKQLSVYNVQKIYIKLFRKTRDKN